jgi:hypothetical protein
MDPGLKKKSLGPGPDPRKIKNADLGPGPGLGMPAAPYNRKNVNTYEMHPLIIGIISKLILFQRTKRTNFIHNDHSVMKNIIFLCHISTLFPLETKLVNLIKTPLSYF